MCITFQGREIDGYKLMEVNVTDGDKNFKNASTMNASASMLADLKDWSEYRIHSKAMDYGHQLIELNIEYASQMERNYKTLARRLGVPNASALVVPTANKNRRKTKRKQTPFQRLS
mmetsp:Transcript_6812/g.7785  ORF Transcript_6812/g.7785 Transcript_6812/m.7785 type:complete len:116 (-) Transcript_6812:119-466(-)